MIKRFPAAMALGVLALAVACSDNKSSSPVAPTNQSPAPVEGIDAAADGSTLKVSAPVQVSPPNGSQLSEFEVTLTVNAATPKFTASTVPLAYRFELLRGGSAVDSFRGAVTSWKPGFQFESNSEYAWRVRAEQGQAFGPWSATWTFKTPDVPKGYIAGGEVYDPLWNGQTVGTINGPTNWVKDVGIQLNDLTSNVEYALQQTVVSGEMSLLVTNMPSNTDGGKTKVMSMRQGRGDITTNDRRFTIEKRGEPAGFVAWRVITSTDQIDTEGAERRFVNFEANKTYLWTSRWGNGAFNLTIREGGANGPVIYNFGKGYTGVYDPDPQLAYIGSPVGRGGPDDASVPGMIVRQFWLSARPRPDFANK